jgi:hypothetical protein
MPVCPAVIRAWRSADPIAIAPTNVTRSPRLRSARPRVARLAQHAAIAGVALLGQLSGCDTPDERSASWRYVHAAILEPACATASCHSKASSAAGLDLSTPKAAYSTLLGRPCSGPEHPQDAPGNYVMPYQPERSKLLYLLRGDRSSIMPPDSRLPASEIAIVERWVLEGALCD